LSRKKRIIEVYVGESNGDSCGFWNTTYVEIPRNTPKRLIEGRAIKEARRVLEKEGKDYCFVGVFNVPPQEEDE